MSFLKSLNISGSALTAQKFRMDIISQNIANAKTTRTENGEPYRRRITILSEKADRQDFKSSLNAAMEDNSPQGVVVSQIIEDQSEFIAEYNPDHPHADENGYVMLPNVNTVQEMIDMMSASRAYEANITAFNATKNMAQNALDIGR
ncbi:MAG: flagellar basal body rod protein FlgC [Eubacteriales bacterium]